MCLSPNLKVIIMFTTPCFIRHNNQKLRDKLQELGYKVLVPANRHYGKFLVCYNGICESQGLDDLVGGDEFIDCGDNEELFIATASLRKDTDIKQYFICIEDEGIYGESHPSDSEIFNKRGSFLYNNLCEDYKLVVLTKSIGEKLL